MWHLYMCYMYIICIISIHSGLYCCANIMPSNAIYLTLGRAFSHWYYSSPSTPEWPAAQPPRTREDHDPASGSDCPSLGTSGRSIKFKWQVPTRLSSQFTGMTWKDVANNSILPISRQCAITPKPSKAIELHSNTISYNVPTAIGWSAWNAGPGLV